MFLLSFKLLGASEIISFKYINMLNTALSFSKKPSFSPKYALIFPSVAENSQSGIFCNELPSSKVAESTKKKKNQVCKIYA